MLTRSGLGAAMAAIALAICGAWWRYEELVIVASAVAICVAVALWSARAAHRSEITRTIATLRVGRGDPIRAVYRATNSGRRRLPPITILDQCDGQEVRVPLGAIAPDDRTESVGLIPTHRRGVFSIGPWSIERIDPLGLSVGQRNGEAVSTIIVHPRLHSLHGPYGSMHTVEDEAVLRSSASDPMSGFVSLREYVDGDDPRLIHWPTSARAGTLMVREHVELRRPEFTVVLDAVDTVATAADFEEMVDVAASIAVHALAGGVDVRLRTTSREHPGTSRPIHRNTHVLDLLTPVQQCDVDQSLALAEVFRGGIDHTRIVLVTGPTGPSTTLIKTTKLAIVKIGEGAETGVGVVLACEDAGDFANRWRPWR